MERLPNTAPGILIRDFPEPLHFPETLSKILKEREERYGRPCRQRIEM